MIHPFKKRRTWRRESLWKMTYHPYLPPIKIIKLNHISIV
jgi:hypothetical protein